MLNEERSIRIKGGWDVRTALKADTASMVLSEVLPNKGGLSKGGFWTNKTSSMALSSSTVIALNKIGESAAILSAIPLPG